MLTTKQRELLMFIHERIKESGVSPSFDEMKEALDLASKSGIHRLITALEERGFIRRLAHRARALEVIKLPDQATTAAPPKGRQHFVPQVVEGSKLAPSTVKPLIEDGRELPLLGKIAAGVPIEAIGQERDRMRIPEAMLGAGEHYLLEIEGDSMINAGILDGDYVIIKKTDTAQSGEIVVALVDGDTATLKRLRKKGASIALEAANPTHKTRIYNADEVAVQGRLVGLMRKYH
ncbi:transcriptional repressor LexA [Asticcacaulis machinosus]|uniref:LexA repressor n=1 Tax=Asticcacaulis machinosus TaxID=2984211 RepID=A0ABT5HGR1_9CAUL|nr:transcriptional repressor LexA [Asticcacaulis machinosus]MDC7674799.1 transcriptional repressor LexA [Asticcacaulis machinosus]